MLHVDFETFCHLDVREVGAQAYARHKSCEVLMMAWAFGDDKPALWVPEGPWEYDGIPEKVLYYIRSGGPVCAHNVEFEWNVFLHVLDIEIALVDLRDTAALALVNGYPKSLAGAASAIGLPQDQQKDKRGKALIRKFCAPRKPTKSRPVPRNDPSEFPEEWLEFQDYCKQDVVVEQAIWNALAPK